MIIVPGKAYKVSDTTLRGRWAVRTIMFKLPDSNPRSSQIDQANCEDPQRRGLTVLQYAPVGNIDPLALVRHNYTQGLSATTRISGTKTTTH